MQGTTNHADDRELLRQKIRDYVKSELNANPFVDPSDEVAREIAATVIPKHERES
jgi:hypothetical protein